MKPLVFRPFTTAGATGEGEAGSGARKGLTHACNGLMALLGLTALAALVARHGFELSPAGEWVALGAEQAVLAGFVCLTLAKLALARDKREHLRSRWADFAISVPILLQLAFPWAVLSLLPKTLSEQSPDALAVVLVAATQVLVILAFVPAAMRASRRLMRLSVQPPLLMVLGFASLILAGTGLLLMPKASAGTALSPVDALFTATSAVCVTGLVVVDTATAFTPLGHVVLLLLIQAGGLGIMTMTSLMALLAGGQARVKEYAQIRTVLEETSIRNIRRTVYRVILITMGIEAAGALLIYLNLPWGAAAASVSPVFFSAFHSVSAFCNAGFALTSANCADAALRDSWGFLGVLMALVVLGGLGIPVLSNLGEALFRGRTGRRRFTLNSKIVLSSTAVLLTGGTALLLLLEVDGTLSAIRFPGDLVHALFLSVSSRTAGFNTLDMAALGPATLYLLCMLMWVGASPASTGGGVKTTTVVVALASIHAVVKGRTRLELFRRRVPEMAVTKAFSTIILSFCFLAGMVFLLLLTEKAPLQEILFEVVSATGTVGLSTGLTPRLSDVGKILVAGCMFAGRVGLLALVLALVPAGRPSRADRTEETVLIT